MKIFLLLFAVAPLTAQNLVMNPGFELPAYESAEHDYPPRCAFSKKDRDFAQLARGWTTFAGMTPDLFRVDSTCGVLQRAHGGQRCAGLINYLPAGDAGRPEDFHELIAGQLHRSLTPGRRYRFSVWVRTDTTAIRTHITEVYARETPVQPVHAGNLGVWFSMAPEPFQQDFWRKIREDALQPQVNFRDVIRTDGQWTELSGVFVPDRPFRHFVIGNFFYDNRTPNDLPAALQRAIDAANARRHNAYGRIKRAAYLWLDDVVITPDTATAPKKPVPTAVETALLRDKKYTFSAGLLFNSGSAELRPEASAELDALTDFLRQHTTARIGIYGHTDNVGSDAYNLELSEQRARAVCRYLSGRGVPAERLLPKGWGEAHPVAPNDTEEGRQQNRRVECRILK